MEILGSKWKSKVVRSHERERKEQWQSCNMWLPRREPHHPRTSRCSTFDPWIRRACRDLLRYPQNSIHSLSAIEKDSYVCIYIFLEMNVNVWRRESRNEAATWPITSADGLSGRSLRFDSWSLKKFEREKEKRRNIFFFFFDLNRLLAHVTAQSWRKKEEDETKFE